MLWREVFTPTFRKDYKNLDRDTQLRVNEAKNEILNSSEPLALGIPKFGKWKGAFGYEIGKAIRILYSFDSGERLLSF
ncbi:MAG: hypothetical protein OK457_05135 [Thaumarchaeota archaeon]|nr:hypothetical protein [Nitrososphaerota archaeon]